MAKPYGDSAPEERPSALLLAPEAPYPTAGGGPLRTASLVEYLARRYHLDVIVFREPGATDPRAAFPPGLVQQVEVVELRRHARSAAARAARNLRRWLRAAPPLMDRFDGYQPAVEAILSRRGARYAVSVIEHFWCAPYEAVLRPFCGRVLLNLHNVESVLLERCGRGLTGPLFRRFAAGSRRAEQEWLPRFDTILSASDEDGERVREVAPRARVEVYPNALPSRPQPLRPDAEQCEIAFSGNLEYHPNIDAVRYFSREVWPAVQRAWPQARWRLIGKNHQRLAKAFEGRAGIEFSGPVDDAVEELSRASVAVAPLLAGSGTRLKIIEAWAAGVPVVSTTIGAEGLPGRDGQELLIANNAADFASAVGRLLGDRELARRIGAAGRRLFEERFTWESGWRVLEERRIL